MMNKYELNELAKDILREYKKELEEHLKRERKQRLDNSEPALARWRGGFYDAIEGYLKKKNIEISQFEKEDLAILLAMNAIIYEGKEVE